ncbi:lysine-specific permease [Scheffersomyces xylosifermentans]|uniref:lysine-specific permease n=1 Tax=Scheffersomyces xylosifermentans TaxID=1304137 RepID=UPI00315D1C9E
MDNEETPLIRPNGQDELADGELLLHSEQHHEHVNTKRLLNSRHISMISIGGIVGTGLFLGIRAALVNGPIISILSYAYISVICYTVIQSVGEMACFMPLNGSVCQFQFIFLSNSIGLAINVIYWISWSITLALEISLIYSVLSFWSDSFPFIKEHQLTIIFAFWLVLTLFNLLPVNFYGEIEFVISILKISFIICWIVLSVYILTSRHVGFKYWTKDLLWGIDTIRVVKNPVGSKVLNIMASLVSSCFTFQSIESIAICSGEIHDAHVNLPKAIKYVLARIIVFYITTLFLLTMLIPCNHPQLTNGGSDDDIFSSPFLIGLINCGISTSSFILSVFNFVILVSMISAANSNIYFGSRCLISMVEEGYFPKFLSYTNSKGVPYPAILLTSSLGLISLFSKSETIAVLFNLLVNLCATSGLIMWLFISVSYLRFLRTLTFNGLDYNRLSFRTKYPRLLVVLNWISIASIVAIILGNGVLNFWNFNWNNFFSCYLTSIILIATSFGLSWYWNEPLLIPLGSIDIFSEQSPFAFEKQ